MTLEPDQLLVRGHIDAIEGGRVYGWAWDPSDPETQQSVAIYHGSDRLGVVMANRYREDLLKLEVGEGHHAFVFDLPASLRQRPASEFSVYFEGSGMALERGPRVFTIQPDGSVDNDEQADAGMAEDLADPGEVAHKLTDQVRAISFRLDKVDENYTKLARVLSGIDQRLLEKADGIGQQLGKQLADHTKASDAKEAKKPAPSAAELKKIQRYLKVCWRDIKGLRKDLEAVELFAVRFDERLQGAADAENLEAVAKKVAQARGLAVVAVALAALAGLFGAFNLFFG